jgi:hypothetical protein
MEANEKPITDIYRYRTIMLELMGMSMRDPDEVDECARYLKKCFDEDTAQIIAEHNEWRDVIRSTGYDGASEIVHAIGVLRKKCDSAILNRDRMRELLVRIKDGSEGWWIREIDAILSEVKS